MSFKENLWEHPDTRKDPLGKYREASIQESPSLSDEEGILDEDESLVNEKDPEEKSIDATDENNFSNYVSGDENELLIDRFEGEDMLQKIIKESKKLGFKKKKETEKTIK